MSAAVNLYVAAFTFVFPVAGFGNIVSSYLCCKLKKKKVVFVVLRDLIKYILSF